MLIDRRLFLKVVCGGIGLAIISPDELFLSSAVPSLGTVQPSLIIGNVREMAAYDIESDSYIVRHDISNGTMQLGVDNKVKRGCNIKEYDFKKERESAVKLLLKEMEKRNIKISDLKPLPPPKGMPVARNYVI